MSERVPQPASGASPGNVTLRMEGLTKSFRGFTAVNNLTLDVARGSIHALIGPNGAGKTTVFNLATKFLQPTGGRIYFNGQDITATPPDAVARMGMVRSFQISAVFAQLTVLENVRIALQRNRSDNFFFWRSEKSLRDMNGRAMELLADVGLQDFANYRAIELSYGRRRVLEIATTLALDPELLLLDEPMSGLGQEDVGRIAELIRRVAASRTVLMVEHNLSVVADLSHRITVLARGEVLADGTYAELVKNPAVVEAYLGTDHG
jgi:branched-chain amino acid transport system ATP-binding protein